MEIKTFLVLYILTHCFNWTLMLDHRWSFPNGVVFVFKKTLPILLFASLYYSDEIKQILKLPSIKELFHYIKNVLLLLLFLGGCYMLAFQVKTKGLGVKWSWYAVTTWCFTLIVYYFLLKRETSKHNALILSFLFCRVAGFIYELPVYPYMKYNVGIYFHISHPFFFDFNYFLIPLLIYYFKKKYKFVMNKFVFPSFFLYLGFSMFYHWYYKVTILPIHRLPAIIFLAVIILSLKRKVNDGEKR